LKAKYTHDGEPIDFDIVAACSIRIDRYKSGDSGFLAARYPRFFVKETQDGHAVMQIVPAPCRGETTSGGRVPGDFLPGVIWFEKPGDYRFGVGYFTEDAFENPKSQLKFLGASIEKATSADWEAFKNIASNNEGMRRRYYDRPPYTYEEAQRIADAGGREVEAAFARGCTGIARYALSDAAREIVRKHWPKGQPRFWAPEERRTGPWAELKILERSTPILANRRRYIDHLINTVFVSAGFPTRTGGGMIGRGSPKIFPPEIFPLSQDRGVPWVFSESVSKSQYLYKDVQVDTGPGKGFLYCYTNLTPGKGQLKRPIPDYRDRESRIRVDGEPVVTPDRKHWSWPNPFYERDEYIYFKFAISLS
jgi:hypothetical protein